MDSHVFRKGALLLLSAVLFLGAADAAALAQETVEKHPKIVMLFDVSASMSTIDGPAKPSVDPATLPSRQDQVLRFLSRKGIKSDALFLEQLLKKAPVTAYRFGATL